eukprot:1869244-Amphidinium_carterae.1
MKGSHMVHTVCTFTVATAARSQHMSDDVRFGWYELSIVQPYLQRFCDLLCMECNGRMGGDGHLDSVQDVMVWVPQLASNAGSMKPVGKRPVQTVQDPVKAVEMQFTKVFRGAKGETYTMDKKDQHSWHCHRQQHGQIKTFTL